MDATPDGVTPAEARLSGAIAAGVALGVGELVASLSRSWQSLVASVDNHVIDLTPGSAARSGIETFGRADKPTLVVGTVLLSLLFGAWLGSATRRRRWAGPVGFAAFGLLGAWAGVADPLASAGGSIIAAVAATAAGIATLHLLLWAAERSELRAVPASGTLAPEDPRRPTATRRAFFGWAGAAGAAAVTAAGLGRALRGPSAAEQARAQVRLPPSPDLPNGLETEVPGVSPLVTPNDDFYRIDTALITPQVDPEHWELRIKGMVDRPYRLGYDDLLELATEEVDVTLSCVSNEVGGDLVGTAHWRGVKLADLLDRAGVQEGAAQVVGRSVDDFTAGFPVEAAYDGRPAIVAVAMNGEPLPIAHGFPARIVVAGLYGYVSATKWLAEIELTTWDAFDGYWIPRGWAKQAPIKTESRIDVPRGGASVSAGAQPIAGVAWAGERGIGKVEIRVDDGPWHPARLGRELAKTTWRQWVLDWDAVPGDHLITVRATDGTGKTQTDEVAPPEPDGATGWHTVSVRVDG